MDDSYLLGRVPIIEYLASRNRVDKLEKVFWLQVEVWRNRRVVGRRGSISKAACVSEALQSESPVTGTAHPKLQP